MEHKQTPLVGLVMGSDSDWKTMSAAAQVLTDFEIPFEARVVSAHRMPIDMLEYAQSAAERGLRVIVAGAGGAAHLPGMLASATVLPVIGVPVPLAHLEGLDSLLSIVQMPGGVPVATVGVGNAKNAALLAVRILSSDQGDFGAQLRQKMLAYQAELRQVAIDKGAALRSVTSGLSG
ncbi:phosphoribosylaminoimidazole carboxylase, catalytic subunit [Mobiluncus mulieris 28-1]|uniref:N5-carboxyaminoimidazole ribonucleotide mutase n=1 Tax=Mobiluncus mulieris TaxID=2052 RepID=A0A2J9KMF4_9ACTO|nr:5-(carboxyamino)imidazole ribonucleotide mutase [Mobiluncus mulieris]EEZ90726.1 phosphoribosylaminoimidazole carboxylase, catalytic subunit [Mobiluncus mulieris 28-1]EFN92789.1 phosphoribosylaminoimidazole carboxylase, catalytic subunit [Mobiluncus mulieris FB024-16]MBB5846826.1 5-(carboxyamino)imidazole ribonucleotide mutase [Mobiluncus mulieris]MCV0012198.1 5-(carboxyamino)imidazole ribonucleotide mutase [Mobiluncus mulieris]PNL42430.1 5-(carboxyamino)imidazole ribonucleotide mutase [Mobi